MPLGKNVFQLSNLGLSSFIVSVGLWAGFLGLVINTIRASCGVRPPFFVLQRTHEATTFSQVVGPPLLRGTTWSKLS